MTDESLEEVHRLREDIGSSRRRFIYFVATTAVALTAMVLGAVHANGRMTERVGENRGSILKIEEQMQDVSPRLARIEAQNDAILRELGRLYAEGRE